MGGVGTDSIADDASTTEEIASTPRRLSEQYCPWCRARHGFGYCAHASWLTQDRLARRGAHFNWR